MKQKQLLANMVMEATVNGEVDFGKMDTSYAFQLVLEIQAFFDCFGYVDAEEEAEWEAIHDFLFPVLTDIHMKGGAA